MLMLQGKENTAEKEDDPENEPRFPYICSFMHVNCACIVFPTACMHMHALTFMHARLEDEERVRKEGFDRCFKHRIRQIYAKHLPEFENELVEQDIHEAGDNVRGFYMALCEQYGEIAGIPMWLPPDDRPDWIPKFLSEKEEGPDEDTETDTAVGSKPSKWKVQITPAKKKGKAPSSSSTLSCTSSCASSTLSCR